MKIPDKLYDTLKWIAVIVIPALVVLIKTVFPAWHIPHAEEISTTVAAVGLFLGAIIGVSTVSYNKTKNIDDYDVFDDLNESEDDDDDTV